MRFWKKYTFVFISLAIVIIIFGCASSKEQENQVTPALDEGADAGKYAQLIKEARYRTDKFHYGNALGSVVFPVYFPLVLPEDFELERSKIELAKPNRQDMDNMEGETGSLMVYYKRGQDTIHVYQGKAAFDSSDVVEVNNKLQLGNDKPYAFYQKRASGYEYVGWRESFNNSPTKFKAPKNDVAKGGEYAFYNNNIQYLIKAKGVGYDELIAMAKHMTIYDDEWTSTNKNAGLGMWQTEKVPWDNKKHQDWQNYLPSK